MIQVLSFLAKKTNSTVKNRSYIILYYILLFLIKQKLMTNDFPILNIRQVIVTNINTSSLVTRCSFLFSIIQWPNHINIVLNTGRWNSNTNRISTQVDGRWFRDFGFIEIPKALCH